MQSHSIYHDDAQIDLESTLRALHFPLEDVDDDNSECSEPLKPGHLILSPTIPRTDESLLGRLDAHLSTAYHLIRVVQDVLELYTRSYFSQGVHIALPHPVDICTRETILNIFRTEKLRAKVFDLFPLMEDLIANWMVEARAKLMAELTHTLRPAAGSTALVAFTYLQCNHCSGIRSFHSALFHDCSNRQFDPKCHMEDNMSSDLRRLKYAVHLRYGRRTWTARGFRLRPGSIVRIQNLIAAVNGGHIETATSIEFDELDPRLVCKLCTTDGETIAKCAMPWRSALFHCLHDHYDFSARDVKWISLRKEDIEGFEKPAVQRAISYLKYDLEPKWACAVCCPYDRLQQPSFIKRQIINHLIHVHGVLDPILSRDFYRITDSEPYLVYPWYIE